MISPKKKEASQFLFPQKNNFSQKIKRINFILLFIPFVFILIWSPISMASAPENTVLKLKVFLDCPDCSPEVFLSQIPFLNLTQEAKEAQVVVRIVSQEQIPEEIKYQINFIGQREFEGDDDSLSISIKSTSSPAEKQQQLAQAVKMGLMRYLGKTPLARYVSIRLEEEVKPTDVEDKWNFWVFSLNASSFLNGEKSYRSQLLFGSFSANRVTEELKISASLGAAYQENLFKFGGQKITSSSESQSFKGLIVKSISEHVSIGAYLSLVSSSFSNIKFGFTPAPAIEFNFFPYSESTRQQLRLLYRFGFSMVNYREETIYEKTKENL